jgi:hypothetical protein
MWKIDALVAGLLGMGLCALLVWFQLGLAERAGALETELRGAVEAAQAKGGHDWARIEVDGQAVSIAGTSPGPAARDDLLRRVRTAAGSGGLLFGGVTVVRTGQIQAGGGN